MIYPKFPKRSLAIIVVCLIVTLAAVGALLLVYLFNAAHSPLVLSSEDGSLATIASSTVGLFRSSLPLLQNDHYEETKLHSKLQQKHATQYKRPGSRESDPRNQHYVGDDEDLDAEAERFDYADTSGGDKSNAKATNLVNRRLDVLERFQSTDYDTEELIDVSDASKVDDVSMSSLMEGASRHNAQYSKLDAPKIESNRGDTIYIDDYEHPSGGQNIATTVYQPHQHQILPKSETSDLEYFYEVLPAGCSEDDDDDYKSKCNNHKSNKKHQQPSAPTPLDRSSFVPLDVRLKSSYRVAASNDDNLSNKVAGPRNDKVDVFTNKLNNEGRYEVGKPERQLISNSRRAKNIDNNLDTLYDNSYGVDNRDDDNVESDIDAEEGSGGGGSGSHRLQFEQKLPVDMETRKFIQRINNRMWKIKSNILVNGIAAQEAGAEAKNSKNIKKRIMVRKWKQINKSKQIDDIGKKFPPLENANASILATQKPADRLNMSELIQSEKSSMHSSRSIQPKTDLRQSDMNVAIEKTVSMADNAASNEMRTYSNNSNKKSTGTGFTRGPARNEEKSAAWTETRTRRIIGNVKKSEERSRQLLLCEEAGGGELCRMLFKGHLGE